MDKLLDLFEEYKGKKIALYGLGTETQKALSVLQGHFEIIGLLDSFETEGTIYGEKILAMEDAIKQEIELVVVVARPGSCKAIAKKIRGVCEDNKIALFDIRGKDLLQETAIVYDFKGLKGYSKADVLKKIEHADAVSFDLFDTLITRNTLLPTDVIAILGARLQEQGIVINNFENLRLGEEKRLSQGRAPRLCEIYEGILSGEEGKAISANKLAEMEYAIDLSLLISRKESVDLLAKAKAYGKKVYITSDTYYSKEQILEILKQCQIEGFDDVLASCEYGIGKVDGLFEILNKVAQTKNILHIGDDVVADIQSAEKHDIATLHLYNGRDLLDSVGGLGLNDYANELSDRIKVGMFVAELFNSPFQFEEEDCRFKVTDAYHVGYLFCAPMISDFVMWFASRVKELEIKNVWLGARDGYLIQKMMNLFESEMKTDYFLTSRISAIRAGVLTEADIRYVDEMKFSGELKDNLWKRFGIDAETLCREEVSDSELGLLKYKKPILENAKCLRDNYKKYISKLNSEVGEIAFFDFVAKGTVQLYLTKLVEQHIKGLYFLQLEPDCMKEKNVDIEPFYAIEESKSTAIYDNYYILETLLTAPHASISAFDADGDPIYGKETRATVDIECVGRAQEGILACFEQYLKICPASERKESKKLDEILLMLIHGVKITDSDFLGLFVEDPFFNRMTKITDVL